MVLQDAGADHDMHDHILRASVWTACHAVCLLYYLRGVGLWSNGGGTALTRIPVCACVCVAGGLMLMYNHGVHIGIGLQQRILIIELY